MKVARRSGAGGFARLVPVPALAALLALPATLAAGPTAPASAAPGSAAPGSAAPVAVATAAQAGNAAAAAVPASAVPGTFTGQGFDACTAPPPDLMKAWRGASPYQAVGIYIGGVNRACQQPQLTAAWVDAQVADGWRLLPIYMGLQPQCTTSNKKFRFSAAEASGAGRAAASDAVREARVLGLPKGSTIFVDVEAYSTTDDVCRRSVLAYQSAWTARLHDLSYLSGFYSSLSSGVADQVRVYSSPSWVRPDYLWFARYDGKPSVTEERVPAGLWPNRRIKQYQSPVQTGGPETWGGRTLPVDRDFLDVRTLPATPFGDFSGNGWSDLLARDTATQDLWVYRGNGTSLGSRTRLVGVAGLNAITRFGDVDRDGHEDVVAREKATGALWLYPGTGSGLAPRVRIGLSGWNAMRKITPVGDLTGDGFVDLLAVQQSTGCLFLYPGRGRSLGPRTQLGCGWNALSELTAIGDLDRDGRVDLLARQTSTGDLWLYPGRAGGLAPRVRVGTGWQSRRDLTGVGDFDRDGVPDLVAVSTATGQLLRFPGRRGGLGAGVPIGTGWAARSFLS
jgi:hypothetical protein